MLFMLLNSNNYKSKPFSRKITNAEIYRLEAVKENFSDKTNIAF